MPRSCVTLGRSLKSLSVPDERDASALQTKKVETTEDGRNPAGGTRFSRTGSLVLSAPILRRKYTFGHLRPALGRMVPFRRSLSNSRSIVAMVQLIFIFPLDIEAAPHRNLFGTVVTGQPQHSYKMSQARRRLWVGQAKTPRYCCAIVALRPNSTRQQTARERSRSSHDATLLHHRRKSCGPW